MFVIERYWDSTHNWGVYFTHVEQDVCLKEFDRISKNCPDWKLRLIAVLRYSEAIKCAADVATKTPAAPEPPKE